MPTKSIQHRDLIDLAGHSLIERSIINANKVDGINKIYLYTSYEKITEILDDSLNYELLPRPIELDGNDVTIEDIIERFIQTIQSDIVVLMHPRCPFLKHQTIEDCLEKVSSGSYESAFIASEYKKLAWFSNKPLNYSINEGASTTHLTEIEPIILESSAVYVFKKKLFEKTRHRISSDPYIKLVGRFEGFEIDTEDDLKIAELIVNSGLDKSES